MSTIANPNTIPWKHSQDIQIPDLEIRDRFIQYFDGGSYAQALGLLTQYAEQLDGKAFVAELINIVTSGLEYLEQLYQTNVTDYLVVLKSSYQVLIDNFRKRTNWNVSIQYDKFNFVVHESEIYFCLQKPPVGTPVTDTTYWMHVNIRGFQGEMGINITIKYDWNAGTAYNMNDIVAYKDTLYYAVRANTNRPPDQNPNDWKDFIRIIKGKIYVGVTDTNISKVEDVVWLQTDKDPITATVSNPINGQLYVYRDNAWTKMYPDSTYLNIKNYGLFLEVPAIYSPILSVDSWTAVTGTTNYQYVLTITSPNITNKKLVILAPLARTAAYIQQFNLIRDIAISGNTVTLTAMRKPSTDIGVKFVIS